MRFMDGKRIAFDSANYAPAWSPNGKRIANANANHQIYVMNPDGSYLGRLKQPHLDVLGNAADNRSPAWSPDGKRIAFASGSLIDVMNFDGSNLRTLFTRDSGDDSGPSWSPDGLKIAFAGDCGTDCYDAYRIYVRNANGTNEKALTQDVGEFSMGSSWSPDGKRIVFDSNARGRFGSCSAVCPLFDIYVMNADGSSQHPLTTK